LSEQKKETGLFLLFVRHRKSVVVGVYCLPLFKHWDCWFQSHSGNGRTSESFSEIGFCPAPQGDLSQQTRLCWLGRLVVGWLLRRPGFDPRPAMWDVMVETMILEHSGAPGGWGAGLQPPPKPKLNEYILCRYYDIKSFA
jgi:hypothetical protein